MARILVEPPVAHVPGHAVIGDIAVVASVRRAVVSRDEGLVAGVGYLLPQPGQNVAVKFADKIVLAAGQIGDQGAVEFNHRQTETQTGQQATHGGNTASAGHGKEQPMIQQRVKGILAVLGQRRIAAQ